MLYDVAALYTSVALGPVAEAFGVSEIRAYEISISVSDGRLPGILDGAFALDGLALAATVDRAVPVPVLAVLTSALDATPALASALALNSTDAPSSIGPVIGPQPVNGPGDLGRVATLSGAPLLQHLAGLPSELLPKFIEANPSVVTQLLQSPPSARMVTNWWGQLGLDTRDSLIQSAPQLVGNLEGVPYSMRNTANRTFLQQTIEGLNTTITQEGRVIAEDARRQLRMLEGVRDALGPSNAKPQRTLLTLDVTGAGKAAIVIGDLRTADYVSYLIPGMFFAVDGQMGDWTDAAAHLYDDQVNWLKLFAREGSADKNATVATVAWLGYETPNLTDVGGPEKAYLGRDLIARAVEGLQSMRTGNEPYVSLLAHSYGSTAALMALTEYNFQVDALALVGSPGSAAQSVNDLHVKNGNVYVGEASWDPVPNSSFFGSDPGSASYGAKPMGVGGELDIITHRMLLGSTGHNEYFGAGTESMRNMALIGIDKGQFVSTGSATSEAKAMGTVSR